MAVTVDTESEFTDEQVSEWILYTIFHDSTALSTMTDVNDFNWYGDYEIGTLIGIIVSSYKKHKKPPTKDMVLANLKYLCEQNRIDCEYESISHRFISIISNPIDIDDDVKKEAIELFVKKSGMYQSMQDFFASQTGVDERKKKVTFETTYQKIVQFNDFQLDNDMGLDALSDDGLGAEYNYLTTTEERVPTGIEFLDKATNGGILRNKFLATIVAGANVGKSLCAVHLAAEALKQDKTVLIISLEMSELVYSRRMIAQLSGCNIDLLGVQIKDVKRNMMEFRKKHPNARLLIKEFPPSSTTVSKIEGYIDNLEKKGIKIDILFVDYLNLLKPNHSNRNDQQHQKIQQVSEELRSLTYTHDFPCWTMTQTQREAMIDVSPKLNNISQSMGAACTSDLVISLYTTSDEEGEGVVNMTVIKSRLGSKHYVPRRFLIDKNTLALIDDGDSSAHDDITDSVQKIIDTNKNNDATANNLFEPSPTIEQHHSSFNGTPLTVAQPNSISTTTPSLSSLDADFDNLF